MNFLKMRSCDMEDDHGDGRHVRAKRVVAINMERVSSMRPYWDDPKLTVMSETGGDDPELVDHTVNEILDALKTGRSLVEP